MMNIARVLGNFFFTSPENDDVIMVSPFIKDDFYLEVPLLLKGECQILTNRLDFMEVMNSILSCLSIKVHIYTRKESKEILDKYDFSMNKKIKIVTIPELHAKLFINSKFIILTSANLFYKSLYLSYEFIDIKTNKYKNSFKALKELLPNLPD